MEHLHLQAKKWRDLKKAPEKNTLDKELQKQPIAEKV